MTLHSDKRECRVKPPIMKSCFAVQRKLIGTVLLIQLFSLYVQAFLLTGQQTIGMQTVAAGVLSARRGERRHPITTREKLLKKKNKSHQCSAWREISLYYWPDQSNFLKHSHFKKKYDSVGAKNTRKR